MNTAVRPWTVPIEIIRGATGLAFMLALVIGGAAGLVMMLFGRAPTQVQVPRLRGLTVPQGEAAVTKLGLKLRINGRAYDPDVPEDHIIRTEPFPGKRVKHGRAVQCVLSLGPRSVKMPRLSGLTLSAAENRLTDIGLSVTQVKRRASDQPRDEVLEQFPEAEATVNRTEGVVLVASGGDEFATLAAPDGPPWVFRRVRITVPRGPSLQRVQVLLQSSSGDDRAVYDRIHRPGDPVSVNIMGRRGWRVRVKVLDKDVFETRI